MWPRGWECENAGFAPGAVQRLRDFLCLPRGQVVASGPLGSRLFQRAHEEVASTEAQRIADTAFSELFGACVTKQRIADAMAAVSAKLKAESPRALDAYPAGRTTEISYLGVKLNIQTRSLLDGLELQIWARIKTASLRQKARQWCLCEGGAISQAWASFARRSPAHLAGASAGFELDRCDSMSASAHCGHGGGQGSDEVAAFVHPALCDS